MMVISDSKNIYLPYHDEGLIKLKEAYLRSWNLNYDQQINEWASYGDRVFVPGSISMEVDLNFSCRGAELIPCSGMKELFGTLAENMTIRELTQIIQTKLEKRE